MGLHIAMIGLGLALISGAFPERSTPRIACSFLGLATCLAALWVK